ncbi:hypothetical protein PLICRDRAFT_654804 [Plicaturopsis crispa FD-325 SS-3]|nr:hypothetical protein PLICRDRAFT_654804 [Plicaturopsis crispa FD-325 SS-3]
MPHRLPSCCQASTTTITSMPPVTETRKTRRALSIGITYGGDLVGPHKDVNALREFLTRSDLSYDVTTMMDEPGYPAHLRPTRQNILVEPVQPGDRMVFHYSGHSSQIDQKKGSKIRERDSKDETIVPEDAYEGKYLPYTTTKMIIDDELYKILIGSLPPGSSLVAIMDTCHSGTMLDLPHVKCNSETFEIRESMAQLFGREDVYSPGAAPGSIVETSLSLKARGSRRPAVSVQIPSSAFLSQDGGRSHVEEYLRNKPKIECEGGCQGLCRWQANVVAFAACGDPQVSLEGPDGSSMTRIIVQMLEKNPSPKLKDAINEIRESIFKKNLPSAKEYLSAPQLYPQVRTRDFMQEPMQVWNHAYVLYVACTDSLSVSTCHSLPSASRKRKITCAYDISSM